jgi:hypothetical protein
MLRYLTLAAGALLALAVLGQAHADVIYDATQCRGTPFPGTESLPPCTVTGTFRAPTPDQLVGLTATAFTNYLVDNGAVVPAGGFDSFSVEDSSANFVIGVAFGGTVFYSFVYDSHEHFRCCTANFLWIRDINDSDTVVGIGRPGHFFVGQAPHAQEAPMPIVIGPTGPLTELVFNAIDDAGDIAASTGLGGRVGFFDLTPRGVPEPATASLFVVGAGFCWWLRRRGEGTPRSRWRRPAETRKPSLPAVSTDPHSG